ncbi:MAG: hypothetical protein GF334_03020 [Candidatus Altiarchaeales archaeon]|nr:hypothetical protein [Candidatus Altiarchaeales archaeon]
MSQANSISGYTIARNVVKFKYPIRECLTTLRPVCEDVVLAYDPYTEDGTYEVVKQLAQDLDLTLYESRWNMDNFNRGLELGVQTDIAMSRCTNQWRLYLQLDEAFHEDDVDQIKELPAQAAAQEACGVDFQRIYFYQNLHTIRRDWCAQITRLTYGDTHTYSSGDGMSCIPTRREYAKHLLSPVWMFHYSRIGDPELISQRVRNMDTFYHPEENLLPVEEVPEYDFVCREFDNYAKEDAPKEVEPQLLTYQGTHPLPFAELYQEFE